MIDDIPTLDDEIRNNAVKSSPLVVRVHLASVDFHLVGAGCFKFVQACPRVVVRYVLRREFGTHEGSAGRAKQ